MPKMIAILLSLALCGGVSAQNARVLTGQGLKRLGVFIGTWKAESTVDAGHPDKVSATYTCTWSANGRYLIADQLVNNKGIWTMERRCITGR